MRKKIEEQNAKQKIEEVQDEIIEEGSDDEDEEEFEVVEAQAKDVNK